MKDTHTPTMERARQMLIDGEDVDEIMKETRLRLKDIRKLEREISKNF
ncbi:MULTISPECIES: hypothetical protein [Clostridiaceae]|nr:MULTISPECIES: hypothetical protein [Clostridiaceae]